MNPVRSPSDYHCALCLNSWSHSIDWFWQQARNGGWYKVWMVFCDYCGAHETGYTTEKAAAKLRRVNNVD